MKKEDISSEIIQFSILDNFLKGLGGRNLFYINESNV